jgi:hypothetical protein
LQVPVIAALIDHYPLKGTLDDGPVKLDALIVRYCRNENIQAHAALALFAKEQYVNIIPLSRPFCRVQSNGAVTGMRYAKLAPGNAKNALGDARPKMLHTSQYVLWSLVPTSWTTT